MPILVSCECGEQFREHAAAAGRQARCPGCGRVLVIPMSGAKPQLVEEITWCEPTPPKVGGKPVASLILGIVSVVTLVGATELHKVEVIVPGFIAGLMAIALGWRARREIVAGRGRNLSRKMARVGVVFGMVGCAWSVLMGFATLGIPEGNHGARRAQCVNNLKQIGLALHNYHDMYGCFPPAAITDATGKPLLSWRVAILPFLEQQGLYARFKLDEPWDSPHNRALMAERPLAYACPSDPNLLPPATRYRGLVGPGAFFEGTEGTKIESFSDGTSSTLAVVEARDAVPWTAPADLSFNPGSPLPAMKSHHSGNGFNALLADGSVRFFKDTIPPATLRRLITRNAMENTDDQSY